MLNEHLKMTAQSSYHHAKINYSHPRERDSFFSIPTYSAGERERKVRVTRKLVKDAGGKYTQEGQVSAVVEKVRIANMDVRSPKRLFDWRISVNLEMPSK